MSEQRKVFWFAVTIFALCWIGVATTAHAQTGQVWSATTPSCENSSAYSCSNTAAWRAPSPAPLLVGAVRSAANCGGRLWDSANVQWTKPANLKPEWCVAYGSTNGFVRADNSALKWPPSTTPAPTPVDCLVSDWSACSIVTGKITRTITRAAANGGAACPALEAPCPDPVPKVSLMTNLNVDPIWVGDTRDVTWSSVNAVSCALVDNGEIKSAAVSGTYTSGPYAAQTRTIYIECNNYFGAHRTTAEFKVLPFTSACAPGWRDYFPVWVGGTGRVAWAKLETPHERWKRKATFWCRLPDGSARQEAWVTGAEVDYEVDKANATGAYDPEAMREKCAQTCVRITDPAIKAEMQAWREHPDHTAEKLGVIGE